MNVNLTKAPEIVQLSKAQLVYLEDRGPFQEIAPKLWHQFWDHAGPILKKEYVDSVVGLSYIDPEVQTNQKFIYQAGAIVHQAPPLVPEPLKVRTFMGGRYARFVLTGPYHQLAFAYPLALQILAEQKIQLRNDYSMEAYLNFPNETPEDQLKTAISIPIQ
jgi:DNA gyrase inhibitor GyrI